MVLGYSVVGSTETPVGDGVVVMVADIMVLEAIKSFSQDMFSVGRYNPLLVATKDHYQRVGGGGRIKLLVATRYKHQKLGDGVKYCYQ